MIVYNATGSTPRTVSFFFFYLMIIIKFAEIEVGRVPFTRQLCLLLLTEPEQLLSGNLEELTQRL